MVRKNKLKSFLIVSIIIIAVVALIIYLLSLGPFMSARSPFVYRAEWETKYNEYEHYEKIKERTKKFIETKKELNNVYSYEIYNVYSLHDYPEYFLVEITCGIYSDFYQKLTNEKYYHLIGFIEKDEYYYITLREGESYYKKANALDYRLYYNGSSHCLYEKDHQIIELQHTIENNIYTNPPVNSLDFKAKFTSSSRVRLRNSNIYGK